MTITINELRKCWKVGFDWRQVDVERMIERGESFRTVSDGRHYLEYKASYGWTKVAVRDFVPQEPQPEDMLESIIKENPSVDVIVRYWDELFGEFKSEEHTGSDAKQAVSAFLRAHRRTDYDNVSLFTFDRETEMTTVILGEKPENWDGEINDLQAND